MTICKADIRTTHKPVKVIYYFLVILAALAGGGILYSTPLGSFLSMYDWPNVLIFLVFFVLFLILIGLPTVVRVKVNVYRAAHCSLELTDSRITGKLRGVFSTKTLDLPIRQVNSISINKNLKDSIIGGGGKRIVIRSSSGMIAFRWVQNADEFVSATLAQIENTSQGTAPVQAAPTPAPQESDSTQNAMEQIKQLKEMKDSGLLTEEEYEEKRKKLLERI